MTFQLFFFFFENALFLELTHHIQVRIYFLQAAGVAGYSEKIRHVIRE